MTDPFRHVIDTRRAEVRARREAGAPELFRGQLTFTLTRRLDVEAMEMELAIRGVPTKLIKSELAPIRDAHQLTLRADFPSKADAYAFASELQRAFALAGLEQGWGLDVGPENPTLAR